MKCFYVFAMGYIGFVNILSKYTVPAAFWTRIAYVWRLERLFAFIKFKELTLNITLATRSTLFKATFVRKAYICETASEPKNTFVYGIFVVEYSWSNTNSMPTHFFGYCSRMLSDGSGDFFKGTLFIQSTFNEDSFFISQMKMMTFTN